MYRNRYANFLSTLKEQNIKKAEDEKTWEEKEKWKWEKLKKEVGVKDIDSKVFSTTTT